MRIPYLPLQKTNAMHLDELTAAANAVISSGWYLRGEATKRFESDYARYIGTAHCVGCGNGLDALTLIFRAYKEMGMLRDGDEVMVPANTYIASVLSITENGLCPVLVEPRWETMEIDDRLLDGAVTQRTRALLLVHMYGRNAWSPAIQAFCDRHHLLLVEDNAQAVGSLALAAAGQPRRTGSLGHAAAHSFYPGKNLGALGDAGAVTTDDKRLADTVRALGNYGSSRKYVFPFKGKNSRIDELQAAMLDVKLGYLDTENQRRREIAAFYYQHISNPDIMLLPGKKESDENHGCDLQCNYHIFPILCRHRDRMQHYLAEKGIGTMIHYPIPPHRQDCYGELAGLQLPVTEAIHAHELSLPCHQAMSDDEAALVCEAINDFSL